MPIRQDPLWTSTVPTSPDKFDPEALELLLSRVTEVVELLEIYEVGSVAEQTLALALLARLRRRGDWRLTPPLVSRWNKQLAHVARTEYPNTLLGKWSFQRLWENDRQAATHFLLKVVDPERVKEDAAQRKLVLDLQSVGPRAIDRLEGLKQLGSRAARLRDNALALLKPVDEQELERMASDWRRLRTPAALSQLYERYISGLPEGAVSLRELERLLGEPTTRHKRDVWYEASSGTSLFLEGDERGMLRGRHLT